MSDAIESFFAWWPDAGPRINAAIEAQTFTEELVEEISAKVKAIDGGLEWEMGPGDRAKHAFVVSGAGDPVKRQVSERWFARAPKDDATWEFHPARPPRPLARLEVGGLSFDETLFRAKLEEDEGTERVHVTLFHPEFEKQDQRLKGTVTFLTLDGLLGEDDVERFVGAIDSAEEEPEGAVTLPDALKQIDALREKATGDRWAVLQAVRDGERFVACVNRALKRVDHLGFTDYVCLSRPMGVKTGVELSEEEASAMEAEDIALIDPLPDGVVYLGAHTGGGTRELMFFAREGAELASLEAFANEHGGRVEKRADPSWEAAARFL